MGCLPGRASAAQSHRVALVEGTLKVIGLQPHAGLYGATAIQHVFKS